MKTCTKCGAEKPRSEFNRNSRIKSGLRSECKACQRAYSMAAYAADSKKILERNARWARENPDKERERHSRWRKENLEKSREIDRRWKKANSEKIIAYQKANRKKAALRTARWRERHPEKKNAYYLANRDKCLAAGSARYYSNREKRASVIKKWQENNPDKINAASRRWRKRNPDKVCAAQVRRESAKSKRTPKWLTKDQLKEMEFFYTQAAMLRETTGVDWHVDHIVPLRGEKVSGLHVPWNLQLLPAAINIRKGNKHE